MTGPDYLHVIDGLTMAQRRVLGAVAINQDGGHHPLSLKGLQGLGLIESYPERLGGHPPRTVTRWRVPIHVHMAWCAWCAESPGERRKRKTAKRLVEARRSGA